MQTTHQIITNYIDQAIEKSVDKAAEKAAEKAVEKYRPLWKKDLEETHKKWKEDTERFLGALSNEAQHQIKIAAEIANGRTTEERVREIVQEENRDMKNDIEIIKIEVRSINTKLSRK